MTDKKVWFITGAGRGMGVDIAGPHSPPATRSSLPAATREVTAAVGEHDDLLAVKLDITDPADAEAAVEAAVERFGRIDVLVNNAGNFYAGFFEEIPGGLPGAGRDQLLRAAERHPRGAARHACPALAGSSSRCRRPPASSGRSSPAYAASKFGVEGWIESLTPEVAPFGIRTMSSSPASSAPTCSRRSRRSTPSPRSTTTPSAPADRRRLEGHERQAGGDPAKLANALVQLASRTSHRALGRRRRRRRDRRAEGQGPLAQVDAHRELSTQPRLRGRLSYRQADDARRIGPWLGRSLCAQVPLSSLT